MNDSAQNSADAYDDVENILGDAIAAEETSVSENNFWSILMASRNLAITLVGLVIFLFFAITAPNFLAADNLLTMIRSMGLIGIVSVGMTYLLVAGEIDISVGSVLAFLIVVLGVLVDRNGLDPWLGMGIVILLGILVGLITGLIRTYLGIPSFIVTLAMLSIYRSLAVVISEQRPSTTLGESFFYQVTGGEIGGRVPWLIIWMLVIMFIGSFILSRTRFGYHIYATGGNLEAATNSGVNTNRIKLMCFAITSGLCGVAAALLWGYLHVAESNAGTGFEFQVIGAAIIGGVALTGGRGTIYGSLVGAVLVAMITRGLVLMGLSQWIGDVVTGLLIMATGVVDLYVRRFAARSLGMLTGDS